MSTHNLCFGSETCKVEFEGYSIHGHVCVMGVIENFR